MTLYGHIVTVREIVKREASTEARLEAFTIEDGNLRWSTSLATFRPSNGEMPGTTRKARSLTRGDQLFEVITDEDSRSPMVLRLELSTGSIRGRTRAGDRGMLGIGRGIVTHGNREAHFVNGDGRPLRFAADGLGCISQDAYLRVRWSKGTLELVHANVFLEDQEVVAIEAPTPERPSIIGCATYKDSVLVTVRVDEERTELWQVDHHGKLRARLSLPGSLAGDEEGFAQTFPGATRLGGPVPRFAPLVLTGMTDDYVTTAYVIDHETLRVAWRKEVNSMTRTFHRDGIWYVAEPSLQMTLRMTTIDGVTGMVLGTVVIPVPVLSPEPPNVAGGYLWIAQDKWGLQPGMARFDARTLSPTFVSGGLPIMPGTDWIRDIQGGGRRQGP
jgi:hypothetical protein